MSVQAIIELETRIRDLERRLMDCDEGLESTYIHIYIHTHTHTYIYTRTRAQMSVQAIIELETRIRDLERRLMDCDEGRRSALRDRDQYERLFKDKLFELDQIDESYR